MDKLEFIARQLAKAQTKKYEHYVVNRVWSLLNDSRVKFVTQQFVSRPEGRAMTDMFFPQLNIHIEVDEGFHKKQIEADQVREADIINATGHEVLRVDVTQDVEQINGDIDKIVAVLRNKVNSTLDFKPWDMEAEMDPLTYIQLGYLDVAENVTFRTIADAATCFGRDYRAGMQKSYFPHPREPNKKLWFPRLYPNADWDNQLSNDEETIIYASLDPAIRNEHIDKMVNDAQNYPVRIVFARVNDPLGGLMYRFKGEYRVDLDVTNYDTGIVLRRVATKVRTYPFDANDALLESTTSASSEIEAFYREQVLTLSDSSRLQLAAMILRDLAVTES